MFWIIVIFEIIPEENWVMPLEMNRIFIICLLPIDIKMSDFFITNRRGEINAV